MPSAVENKNWDPPYNWKCQTLEKNVYCDGVGVGDEKGVVGVIWSCLRKMWTPRFPLPTSTENGSLHFEEIELVKSQAWGPSGVELG